MLISSTVNAYTPKIFGNITSPECSSAFRLAKSMFKSTAPRLYAPLKIPNNMNSELVLGTSALDISGGNVLEANEKQFKKIPKIGYSAPLNIYWGIKILHGKRIVVEESFRNWQGDRYLLYLLDSIVTQDDFSKNAQLRAEYGKSSYLAFIEETWRPPLIFLEKKNQKLWFVTVGEPFEILADWNVYKQTTHGFKRNCTVRFHPKAKNTIAILPNTIQTFIRLLNKTLGSGANEGTLHPTMRIRLNVQHVWANAAIRPWSLSESDVYNSTEEIKSGLLEWSKQSSAEQQIYKKILQLYPLTEKELGRFYMRQFHLPQKKAKHLANWVLDIAFRKNYIFSNGGKYFRYDNINTNPWQSLIAR